MGIFSKTECGWEKDTVSFVVFTPTFVLQPLWYVTNSCHDVAVRDTSSNTNNNHWFLLLLRPQLLGHIFFREHGLVVLSEQDCTFSHFISSIELRVAAFFFSFFFCLLLRVAAFSSVN